MNNFKRCIAVCSPIFCDCKEGECKLRNQSKQKDNKVNPTIQEWLKDVYYDNFGQYLWNKIDKDGGSQMIGEIRGWGALQNQFDTQEQASKFQDEVGEFIAQAIREKIERLKKK
jgi:hypothetical protein